MRDGYDPLLLDGLTYELAGRPVLIAGFDRDGRNTLGRILAPHSTG